MADTDNTEDLAKKIGSEGSTKTSSEVYDAKHGSYKEPVLSPNLGSKPINPSPFNISGDSK